MYVEERERVKSIPRKSIYQVWTEIILLSLISTINSDMSVIMSTRERKERERLFTVAPIASYN